MRALFVYKYLTLGGVEAVLRARLEGLPGCGVEAQAWFLQDGEGRGMFAGLEGRVRVGGLEALRSFLASERFDAVSVIDTPEVFPLLGGPGGPRLIVEAHTPYLENLEYLRALDPGRVAACWAPSQHQRKVALRRLPPGIEVRVVPNALPRAFLEAVRPFEPAPPRPVVAWVGRLDALKNWRGFVEVASRIWRTLKDVEFWMAGDSPEPGAAEALFRAAWRAGIAGRLFWYRALPHERAPRWLDAVRDSGGLLISTSRGESFGMAVAEAMARGVPVVAPALGPFPELIEHGVSGLLYRAGSGTAAAVVVRRLLGDAGLRGQCGAGARASMLEKQEGERAVRGVAEALGAVGRE